MVPLEIQSSQNVCRRIRQKGGNDLKNMDKLDSAMKIWRPQEKLERADEVFRREGARGLFFKLLGKIFYRRLILYERSIIDPVKKTALPKFLSFSILGEAELGEYSNFCPDASSAEVKQRLAEGQNCFVLRSKGKIVHGAWAMTGGAYIKYLSCDFSLRQDVAYIYESFSLAEYRGRGLPLIRFGCMVPRLRAIGCRFVIAAILPENKAGMRPPLKAGYRHYGTIGFMGVGKWRRTFCRVKHVNDIPLISPRKHPKTQVDNP
jgi:hypothetical protein